MLVPFLFQEPDIANIERFMRDHIGEVSVIFDEDLTPEMKNGMKAIKNCSPGYAVRYWMFDMHQFILYVSESGEFIFIEFILYRMKSFWKYQERKTTDDGPSLK
jgi:hypothetical protein